MPRAILLVMDSVGVGGAIDSDKYFNGSISDQAQILFSILQKHASLALQVKAELVPCGFQLYNL